MLACIYVLCIHICVHTFIPANTCAYVQTYIHAHIHLKTNTLLLYHLRTFLLDLLLPVHTGSVGIVGLGLLFEGGLIFYASYSINWAIIQEGL